MHTQKKAEVIAVTRSDEFPDREADRGIFDTVPLAILVMMLLSPLCARRIVETSNQARGTNN